MSIIGIGWASKYRDLRLVLRQCGPREFRITVGDGRLTYFYPEKDCDFHTARLRAYDHGVKFARLRSLCEEPPAGSVEALEWEPVELTE